jgi:hypothetical protein
VIWETAGSFGIDGLPLPRGRGSVTSRSRSRSVTGYVSYVRTRLSSRVYGFLIRAEARYEIFDYGAVVGAGAAEVAVGFEDE